MSTSPAAHGARPTTAIFIRAVRHSIDEGRILDCPTCARATVPVPDPQRSAQVSHCYRCGAEYQVAQCAVCGAAWFRDAAGGPEAAPPRCPECAG